MTAFNDFAKSMGRGSATSFPKRLIALCALAFLGAGTADAATTHSAADGVLTIDVPSGEEENFNLGWVNGVTPAITNIVKRGAGKMLSPNNISTYTGDFDIEEGIWCCTNSGSGGYRLGAQSGTIHVRDGASIEYAGSYANPGDLSGKTVHLYGAGAANAKEGAKIFLSQSIQMGDPGLGNNVRVVLHDDAAFYSRNRLKLTGTFDLGGKVLTLKNNSYDIGGVVTNGGAVVLANNSTWMAQSAAVDFAADCAANAYVEIGSGSTLNIKTGQTKANGWTLKNKGGTMTCNANHTPADANVGNWDGPVELSGAAKISRWGSDIANWGVKQTVFNIKGPVSGSGTLMVGPGWLNLHGEAESTYAGAVTVQGKSTKREATASGELVLDPGSGGIGVWNGASVFTNASSITLKDSARVEFMDGAAASVGTLRFVGDTSTFTNGDPGDDTQSIKGGSVETRSMIAGLEKTGTNTLVVGTSAHFTGTATISEGILKIPYRSTRGTPGLVESQATPKTVDTWTDIQYIHEPTYPYYRIFTPWNPSNDSHCNVTEKGVCAVGAQRAYKGMINTNNADWDDGYVTTLPSDKKSGRNAWWYSGYVWNNTDAPATYTVWCGGQSGSAIWLGEDHSTSIQLKVGRDNTQHGKPVADALEFTLQPGATKIDIVVIGDEYYWCQSVPSNGERYGLVYAPTSVCTAEHLNELIVDYYDNASTASTNALSAALRQFSEFKDEGGVGELFTADIYGDGDGSRKTALLPVFDDLRFENGTKLDLDGNLDFVVKNLVGSPTVVNAVKMTVTNNWTICAADFPKGNATEHRPMTVAGTLVFAEGATFSVDGENAIERNQSGVVVASATGGIEGCPKQAAGGSKKWKLVVDGNNLRLRATGGFMLIVR